MVTIAGFVFVIWATTPERHWGNENIFLRLSLKKSQDLHGDFRHLYRVQWIRVRNLLKKLRNTAQIQPQFSFVTIKNLSHASLNIYSDKFDRRALRRYPKFSMSTQRQDNINWVGTPERGKMHYRRCIFSVESRQRPQLRIQQVRRDPNPIQGSTVLAQM